MRREEGRGVCVIERTGEKGREIERRERERGRGRKEGSFPCNTHY